MSRKLFFSAVCALLATSSNALAEDTPSLLQKSRMLATEKRYDEALEVLHDAQMHYPDDADIKLAIARTLSWKGDRRKAVKILSSLDEKNSDVLLLKADLKFGAGHFSEAEALYRKIIKMAPGYQDAKDGLQRATNARRKVERSRKKKAISAHKIDKGRQFVSPEPVEGTYVWQVDTGFEISNFSRVPQKNWNQEFFQFTRFSNDRATAIHGKVVRYEEFGSIDDEYEIGIDQRFSSSLHGHLYISGSPDPVFRPQWRLDGNAGLRISPDKTAPIWVTLDARHDVYPAIDVETLNPGFKVEPLDNWSLAGRLITVSQPGIASIYGWDIRIDGEFTEGKRFYIGYADAPDTVAAVTVRTKTWFFGLALDLTPVHTLRLGYTHDDRENSYIRNVVNASLSYKF